MTTAPSGCHWCGVTEYDHGKLWSSATDDTGRVVGFHRWAPPPQELIKKRMLARRAAPRIESEATPR